MNNAGIVYLFRQPTVNLGTLETDGIDVGARYSLRDTAAGNFAFQIDWTHINKYDNLPAENAAIVHVAGTYDRQFGNYAENRATATIGWNMNKFDAQIGARFIDDIVLLLPQRWYVAAGGQPAAADRFVRATSISTSGTRSTTTSRCR